MMRYLVVALSLAMVSSARANAQGMISGAKAVAGRAAGAANAHTAAEQNPNGAPAPATATAAKTTPIAASATPAASAKTTPVAAAAAAKTTPVAAAPAANATTKPVAATASTKALPAAKSAATTKLAPAVAPAVTSDTGARSISVTQRGIKGEVSLNREVFSYDAGGRRDPFVSLLRDGDLRPDVGDLCLMVVLYDPTGRNSIGIVRDVSTPVKEEYRLRVGVTLGRMRVAQIEPRQVVFTIEEIGFSRQEALPLGCSSTARTQ
jgi:hypothetical protein